jgi:hypothetical protein
MLRTIALLSLLATPAHAEWRIMQSTIPGDVRVGDVIPLVGNTVPNDWALVDGRTHKCTDVPKLCEVEPSHAKDGLWTADMTRMIVSRAHGNTRQTKWIIKIK